jgi:hypothetical protein
MSNSKSHSPECRCFLLVRAATTESALPWPVDAPLSENNDAPAQARDEEEGTKTHET